MVLSTGRVSSLSGPASACGGLLFSRRQEVRGSKAGSQLGKERVQLGHMCCESGGDSASPHTMGRICPGTVRELTMKYRGRKHPKNMLKGRGRA